MCRLFFPQLMWRFLTVLPYLIDFDDYKKWKVQFPALNLDKSISQQYFQGNQGNKLDHV